MKILQVNSSVQTDHSVSRKLVTQITEQLGRGEATVVSRDLGKGELPLLSPEMVGAFYTSPTDRSAEQKALLEVSDTLVAELREADVLIFGVPIYNFGVPGALKAYFDLVARVGLTFQYTDQGPRGLLKNKRAYVVITSGGTGLGSTADFASGHVRQFLNFLGIAAVEFINASQLLFGAEQVLAKANAQVEALAVATA
ncbi:MAG: NAD(P)H-dependent oxidoreductase [Bacteroidota bacterium]